MHLQRPVRAKRVLLVALLAGLAIALLVPPRAHGATLVHWWKANGDAVDAIAANNGSLLGDTAFVPGHDGQAFSFDGNDDYVAVPDLPSHHPAGSFTLDGWAATTSTGQNQIAIQYECANFCPPSAAGVFEIELSGGQAQGFVRDAVGAGPDGGGQSISGGPMIADGSFHHVALIRDVEAGFLSLYVDGVVAAEEPLDPAAAGAISDNDGEADPLTIGAEIQGGTSTPIQEMTGAIDDVRLWSGTAYPDATAPGIAPVVTGPLGNDGWYTGDVTVSWVVTDAQSVVRSSTGCGTSSVTADTAGTTFGCQASSVGGTAAQSVSVKRDATPPAVTCPAAPTFASGAVATVTATVADAGSGPSAPTASAAADTATEGGKTVKVAGTDVAGNRTEVSCAYNVAPRPAAPPPPAAAPPALDLPSVVTLPSTKRCVSRRNFRIRIKAPAGVRITSVKVAVTGRPAKVVKGKALTAPVDLRGLPKGRFTVTITVRTSAGQIRGTRTYRTCAPRRGSG